MDGWIRTEPVLKLFFLLFCLVSCMLNKNRSCIETPLAIPYFFLPFVLNKNRSCIETNREVWLLTEDGLNKNRSCIETFVARVFRVSYPLNKNRSCIETLLCQLLHSNIFRWIRTEAVLKPFLRYWHFSTTSLNKNRSCIET